MRSDCWSGNQLLRRVDNRSFYLHNLRDSRCEAMADQATGCLGKSIYLSTRNSGMSCGAKLYVTKRTSCGAKSHHEIYLLNRGTILQKVRMKLLNTFSFCQQQNPFHARRWLGMRLMRSWIHHYIEHDQQLPLKRYGNDCNKTNLVVLIACKSRVSSKGWENISFRLN